MSTGDRLPHVFPLGTAPQIPGLVLTHNRTSQSCRWVDPNGNGPKTNAETAAWGVITRAARFRTAGSDAWAAAGGVCTQNLP